MSHFFTNYNFNSCFLSEIRFLSNNSALAVKDFLIYLHDIYEQLVENIKKSQDYQAKYYNVKHQPIEFKLDNIV